MMTIPVRPPLNTAELSLIEAHRSSKSLLSGLDDMRHEAISAFAAHGLPHRRIEGWKYFDARTLLSDLRGIVQRPDQAAVPAGDFNGFDTVIHCFSAGFHIAGTDHGAAPHGLKLYPLSTALSDGNPLVRAHLARLVTSTADTTSALANAFVHDGLVVHVEANQTIETPLVVDFAALGAGAQFPRLLIVLEDGAKATLIEQHHGGKEGTGVHSAVEIVLGKNAELHHIDTQWLSPDATLIAQLGVELKAGAHYRTFSLAGGAKAARRQYAIGLTGEGGTIALGGATLGTGQQILDTTLVVDHAVPGCSSRETYKYVLGGEARGVFQGKIVVRPNAQKTDGQMSARGLLLHEGAEFNAKPELEIFADDVQCAHGATAGELDEDLLFYLMARGLPASEAKGLLVNAFIGEALEGVEHEGVRGELSRQISCWLKVHLESRV